MAKTGLEILKERGIDSDIIPEEDFAKAGLPMVVECYECTTTMAFPTAIVDENGYTYCEDCAGVLDS